MLGFHCMKAQAHARAHSFGGCGEGRVVAMACIALLGLMAPQAHTRADSFAGCSEGRMMVVVILMGSAAAEANADTHRGGGCLEGRVMMRPAVSPSDAVLEAHSVDSGCECRTVVRSGYERIDRGGSGGMLALGCSVGCHAVQSHCSADCGMEMPAFCKRSNTLQLAGTWFCKRC